MRPHNTVRMAEDREEWRAMVGRSSRAVLLRSPRLRDMRDEMFLLLLLMFYDCISKNTFEWRERHLNSKGVKMLWWTKLLNRLSCNRFDLPREFDFLAEIWITWYRRWNQSRGLHQLLIRQTILKSRVFFVMHRQQKWEFAMSWVCHCLTMMESLIQK